MPAALPSIERLRELLVYNPDTGELRWRIGRPGASAGSIAGCNGGKYTEVRVDRKLLQAHRVAWAIFYGKWPSSDLDHKDADKSNNRIINLREATESQNAANRTVGEANTSGVKGVTWDADRSLWRAQIMHGGKNIFLGRFSEKDAAGDAYAAKATEIYGEFARME